MDVETLKVMQEGHGGWNPRMAEVSLLGFIIMMSVTGLRSGPFFNTTFFSCKNIFKFIHTNFVEPFLKTFSIVKVLKAYYKKFS